jgi:phenylacetic acid degradation protein
MNAVIMDNAVIGEATIVAACAFVKAGAEIPAGCLVAGMPAKVIRQLSEQEIAWKSDGTRTYHELTRRSLATMEETAPLTAVEPNRQRIDLPDVLPLVELKNRAAKADR